MFNAKVVLDSIGPNGKRLITVEARYWRAIHAEIMTHRDRARSAASSRAIPFIRVRSAPLGLVPTGSTIHGEIGLDPLKEYDYIVPNCTYSYIKHDAFVPIFIGSEKPGMQSGSDLEGLDREAAVASILRMRDFCLNECEKMFGLGVHKSIINRYLEPWSYITTLMTATEWKNFFRLRIHEKAEKHFNLIATMIKEAIDQSIPVELKEGQWHLPFIQPDEGTLDEVTLKQVSAGRCARVSYLNHDGKRDLIDDIKVFNRLIMDDRDVIHAAALEHVAQATSGLERSGPFVGWKQFRKEFENENVEG